jgi:hypothetical protein
MFFCCSICAVQFRGLVERIKKETGWPTLESIEISGDRRGRTCVATYGSHTLRTNIAFNSEGELLRFDRVAPT